MITVVYLVLAIAGGSGQLTSQSIPQANIKQCLINAKHQMSANSTSRYAGRYKVVKANCIVGVK